MSCLSTIAGWMRQRAFTLIELLVVMAIIALLLAVIAPALARAKQQSQAIACLNNLRQMAIAAHTYAQNNRDFYPLAYDKTVRTSGKTISYVWDFTSIRDSATRQTIIQPGLLWQGQTIEKIQQCPSFKGNSNWDGDPYTGYNYNTSYIGRREFNGKVFPVRTVEVSRPFRCALFGDGQIDSGANKFMRSPLTWEGDNFWPRTAGTQGYRHRGMTNVAYCDGSAKSVKRSQEQLVFDRQQGAAEGTGFLSTDNSAYSLK